MLGADSKCQASQPKGTFWKARKMQKSAVKHSIEKPILLNFVSFSAIFCQTMS